MSIAREKVRVALSLPKDTLDVFKEDARSLDLTLSKYVYLLLAANSSHLDEFDSFRTVQQLEFIRDGLSEKDAKAVSEKATSACLKREKQRKK